MDELPIKRTVKDTVFRDIFCQPEYQLMLFQELHPELTDVTADDIAFASLNPVLLDREYNDFGMVVRDRFLILAEAQSTWSLNILLRSLLYTASTYKEYIDKKGLNIYQTAPVPIPRPEIYVVYTGERPVEKETLSFSEEFFGGAPSAIEITVRVIHDPDGTGILSQYIFFCRVVTEQVRLHGRTKTAIDETIRICRERGKLAEYLASRQQEVISIMEELFSFETNMRRILQSANAEGRAQGFAEGEALGEARQQEKIAIKLLQQHMAVPFIAGITELSEERLRQLAKEHGLTI